jgi:hypothetical protein
VDHAPFQLPRVGALLRHAGPRVLEGMVLPVAVFLVALRFLGVAGAVAAGLGFSYAAVGWRLAAGRRVPGLLILGAVTLTARSVLTLATGSVFLYFLQPTLGTALVATAFLLSMRTRRPLAERLARDFCPIPTEVLERAPVRRFFTQITLLWAATQLANALITLWLLLTESVGVFVVARTAVSLALTASAITVSVVWFRRSLGAHVVFARRGSRRAPEPLPDSQ